jgi:hypothetical protein
VFIAHAAHQTTAKAGYFRRVECQVLFFDHADAYWCKPIEPVTATAGFPTGSQSFDNLGFVTDSYLSQLDASPKFSGKVPDESSEIDSLLSGEVEKQLFSIEEKFHVDQFHGKLMDAQNFP